MINNGFNDLEDELNNAIKEKCDKSYNKGLEDAWKLYNIALTMPRNELCKILNIEPCSLAELIESISPQEALAKLEAYEKENEIKVGDVVEIESTKECYVILAIYGKIIWGYSCEGNESPLQELDGVTITKTGKHIDITSALEQLRGDEA